MSTSSLPRERELAIGLVQEVGELLRAELRGARRIEFKGSPTNLVTEMDARAEALIVDRLTAEFPDDAILAEERGARAGRSGRRWIVDPLDGTTNYAHGLPIFCSSLALEVDGQPIVAAVYDPCRRELFTAERGQGARLNGQPLRVSGATALIDALLVTGFHYEVHQDPDEVVALFGKFITQARAIRRLGSAALDLCYVAAGRFDGFWEKKLQPWDVAGGALIVSEAGGRVTAMSGGPYTSREGSVLATNSLIHTQMLKTIRG